MKIYHDEDVDLKIFDGKKIAVLGYGAQGRAQALCFNDSGLDVTVGARRDGKSWERSKRMDSRSRNSQMRSRARMSS